MAKKKGKRRAVTESTGNIGSMESYLTPGTPERERLLQAQEDDIPEEQLIPQPTVQEKEDVPEDKQVEAAYAGSQGVKNYRNFMKKYDQVEETRDIIEDGLGHEVSAGDLNDELYDPTVHANEFKKEAVSDHAGEFKARQELPEIDTNGDGQVDDQDDVYMTPGMKRMSRYL